MSQVNHESFNAYREKPNRRSNHETQPNRQVTERRRQIEEYAEQRALRKQFEL